MKFDHEYLAGFTDAEGCFWIYNVKGHLRHIAGITIAGVYKPTIEYIANEFGVSCRPMRTKKRLAWQVCFQGDAAKRFIDTVHPILIEKKDQAELVFNFLQTKDAQKPGKIDWSFAPELTNECARLKTLQRDETEIPVNFSDKYLSGFFDGDGSFGIYNRALRIKLCGVYRPLLKEVQCRYGGYLYLDRRAGKKDNWVLHIRGDVILPFCKELLPHLREKKTQAEMMVQSLEYRATQPRQFGVNWAPFDTLASMMKHEKTFEYPL